MITDVLGLGNTDTDGEETHTRKCDRSEIVEKHVDDLLTQWNDNFEQTTQRALEESDESTSLVDSNVV
ncbi:hypothetical protein PIB30_086717 [Stylosanthes scabra]|uniref:Uncharacterized protein n=1 Tax=Stylosanthes scabra TaxID=79078 RepID=A0ABU6VV48_9FABA|nr:hypothetical protein [Stylosanthes scabra]